MMENSPLLPSSSVIETKATVPSTTEDIHSDSDTSQHVTTKFDNRNKEAVNKEAVNNVDFSEKKKKANSQTSSYETITSYQNLITPTKEKGFLSQFTGRTRNVLILSSLANFLACCAFALPAPFYPLVAERKGMSLTVIGFVFSVFQLVVFLVSPIIGNYLTKIGTKFVFLSGIFVGGVCVILFGLLDKCPNGTPFIVMSILCRSVEALGCAAFITASFAIISNDCRHAIGIAYAVLETSAGLGYMVGPAIGGGLYELGGYGLPFYVMGVLVLLNGMLIYRYLPAYEYMETRRRGSMTNLFRSPLLVVSLLNVLVAEIAITVFDTTFAKKMEAFGISAGLIGLFFIIHPTLYSCAAPVWGYLTDRKDRPKTLLIVGDFIFAIGYFFMGPAPVFPFLPNTIWITVIGLVLIGFSFGMVLIPAMTLMVVGAHELNYEANMDTYALVSGLYNSVNSFGGFLGPMVGGIIVQKYGHRVGYTIVSFMSLFAMVVGSGYFILRHHRRQDPRGRTTGDGMDDNETTVFIRQGSHPSDDEDDVMKIRRCSVHLPISRAISIPDHGQ